MIREERIMTDAHDEAIARALVGIDKVWAEVRRTPWVERDLAHIEEHLGTIRKHKEL